MIWPPMSVVLLWYCIWEFLLWRVIPLLPHFIKAQKSRLQWHKIHGQPQRAIYMWYNKALKARVCLQSSISNIQSQSMWEIHEWRNPNSYSDTQYGDFKVTVGLKNEKHVWRWVPGKTGSHRDLGLIRNLKCVVSLCLSQYPIVNTCWPPKLSLWFQRRATTGVPNTGPLAIRNSQAWIFIIL